MIAVCDQIGLTADHFIRPHHGLLYNEIRAQAVEMGKAITANNGITRVTGPGTLEGGPTTATIFDWLIGRGTLDACGGGGFILRIGDNPAGVPQWAAQRVKAEAARRRAVELAGLLSTALTDRSQDLSEIAAHYSAALTEIEADQTPENVVDCADLAGAFMHSLHNPESEPVYKTGIDELDEMFGGGLIPGRLMYVAARPGHGKTALKIAMMAGAAARGARCHSFELEMTATRAPVKGSKHRRSGDVSDRLIASQAEVPLKAIRHYRSGPGRYGNRDRAADELALSRAAMRVSQLPITWDDTPSITYTQLFGKMRRMKARHPDLKIVAIDYIGLIRGEKGEKAMETLAQTSKGLKAMAKELDVMVICLSQLNRDCEDTKLKRPAIHHLRNCGNLEQDADHVVLLQRPCNYEEWEREVEALWVADAKGRNDGRSEVVIRMDATTQRISGPAMFDPVKSKATGTGGGGAQWLEMTTPHTPPLTHLSTWPSPIGPSRPSGIGIPVPHWMRWFSWPGFIAWPLS